MDKNELENSEWRLTVEELRKFKGFENISNEEAKKVIDTLVQLSLIANDVDKNDKYL